MKYVIVYRSVLDGKFYTDDYANRVKIFDSMIELINAIKDYDVIYVGNEQKFKEYAESNSIDITDIEEKIEDFTQITEKDEVDIKKLKEAIEIAKDIFPEVRMGGGYLAYQIVKNFSDRLRILTKREREIADEGFVGGRVEAVWDEWYGEIVAYDINSAYPYLLAYSKIPDTTQRGINILNAKIDTLIEYEKKGYTGLVYAEVVEKSLFPILPVRIEEDREKTIYFPNGKKAGWFFSKELVFASRVSDLDWVDIKECILYPVIESPFTDIIEHLIDMRYKYKKENPYVSQLIKKAVNSIYGILGRRTEEGKLSNRIIAGYITALQRMRLMDTVIKIHNTGAEVLYYDTDSVIVDVRNEVLRKEVEKKINVSDAFGSWSIRNENIRKFVCGGIRQYQLEYKNGLKEIRWKGIPLSTSDIEEIDIKNGRVVIKQFDAWKGDYIKQEIIHKTKQKRDVKTGEPFTIIDGKIVIDNKKKIKIG